MFVSLRLAALGASYRYCAKSQTNACEKPKETAEGRKLREASGKPTR
jgi:hypothetical protein